jgi:molecular chaperone DnaK
VSAKDEATGKEQKIRIEASSGLSDSEIDRMVNEAEEHASEDKQKKEEVENRNRLEHLVYHVEKESKEWVDRVDETNKERLNAAIEKGKQALRSGETEEIKLALEELNQAFSAAGASLYDQQEAEAPTGEEGEGATAEAGEASPEEDVVEADYEIVDEAKSE